MDLVTVTVEFGSTFSDGFWAYLFGSVGNLLGFFDYPGSPVVQALPID